MVYSGNKKNEFCGFSVFGKIANQAFSGWLLTGVFLLFFLGNTPFKKLFYAVFILIYFPVFVFNSKVTFDLLRHSKSLLMLLFFLFASYSWSYVPWATFDAIQSQTIFILFVLAVYVGSYKKGFYSSIRLSVMILLCLIVIYCSMFPSDSLSVSGVKGFYIQKNLLGAMSALSALILFYAPCRNKLHIAFGGLAIALLLASRSKTSISLFVACAAFIPVANYFAKNLYLDSKKLLLSDVLRTFCFVLVIFLLLMLVFFRDNLLDMFWAHLPKSALTGRGMLWLAVVQQIRTSSLLGFGPGVFWQAGRSSEIAQTTLYQKDPYWVQNMISSDGGYVDLVASLGFLGLVVFLFTAVDLYRRLFKYWTHDESKLIFVLVTFILLHAITESTILYSTNILWFIYIISYFKVAGFMAFEPISSRFYRLARC